MATSPFPQRLAFTFKVCPFLDFLQFTQRPGVGGGGGGGSLKVLIRTGSPGENTQTYLYILFQEGSSPRARRSCLETNSCPSNLPPSGDEPTERLRIQRTFSRSSVLPESLTNTITYVSAGDQAQPRWSPEPQSCSFGLKLHFKCERRLKIHM